METLLYYLLKVSVSLTVVFLFYHFVLRKLTFYNWNRWFLLGYSLLGFIIPFVNIGPVLEQNNWTSSNMISWVPVVQGQTGGSSEVETSTFSATSWVLLILFAGMLLMLLRLLLQFVSFRRMMRKAVYLSGTTMKLFEVQEPIIPFSFGNAIFINRQLHTEAELQEIIRHEFVHIRQRHSIDILWTEWICLVNWFNPFAWLLKKAIRQNLEFIADQQVLDHGINKKEYQYLLLKVTGNNQYSIATPFNFSSLKKRIAMMNKLRSARIHLVRFLFVLPLLALLLLAFRNKWEERHMHIAGLNKTTNQLGLSTVSVHDTLPPPAGDVNAKGYKISIADAKGNCTVVIKDRNNNVIKKLLLTDWNQKEDYYEGLYGKIPPPPPPPPAPRVPGKPNEVPGVPMNEFREVPDVPVPSVPVKLPEHVKSINIHHDKAVVQMKNGITETYLLDQPEQLKQFEQKYGKRPAPPPPPKNVKGEPLLEERRLQAPEPPKTVYIMGSPVLEEEKIKSQVLVFIDGKKSSMEELKDFPPSRIKIMNVIKGPDAVAKYGNEAKEGAIEIITRESVKEVIVHDKPLEKKEAVVTGTPLPKEKPVQ